MFPVNSQMLKFVMGRLEGKISTLVDKGQYMDDTHIEDITDDLHNYLETIKELLSEVL